MSDSTPSEPEPSHEWVIASIEFDGESMPDDTSQPLISDQHVSTAEFREQFHLVREAFAIPVDIPHDLLRFQVARAVASVEIDEHGTAAPTGAIARIDPSPTRRRPAARWLVAAASVAIVSAGLLSVTRGTSTADDRADSTAKEVAPAQSGGADSALTTSSADTAIQNSPDEASGEPVADSPPTESRSDQLTNPPSLGVFTSDEDLANAVSRLIGAGVMDNSTALPAPVEPGSAAADPPSPETAAPPPTTPPVGCPTDPTDILVGEATVAGVPTRVTIRDAVIRFINLATCEIRTPASR